MAQRVGVGDVQAMIDFRLHLMKFNRDLADQFASMRTHYQSLGDVWTDRKYDEFGHALAEADQGIERYLAKTEDHEMHLMQLIERLHAFLDT